MIGCGGDNWPIRIMCGGTWRCAEVFSKRWWGKNQDFMLIRFLNAGLWLVVLGTINQSELCTEVCRGAWRGTRRCAEVCGGFSKRWWGKNQDFMLIRFLNAGIWLVVVGTIDQSESCAEVCGGVQRGVQRCVEWCMEVFQRGGGEKIRILC